MASDNSDVTADCLAAVALRAAIPDYVLAHTRRIAPVFREKRRVFGTFPRTNQVRCLERLRDDHARVPRLPAFRFERITGHSRLSAIAPREDFVNRAGSQRRIARRQTDHVPQPFAAEACLEGVEAAERNAAAVVGVTSKASRSSGSCARAVAA